MPHFKFMSHITHHRQRLLLMHIAKEIFDSVEVVNQALGRIDIVVKR